MTEKEAMNNRILIVVGTRPNFIKITRFKQVNEAMGHPFDIRIGRVILCSSPIKCLKNLKKYYFC